MANKYLEKDMAYAVAKKKEEEEKQKSKSWFGKVWTYIPGTGGGADLSLQLTDDIMKELYQEINNQEAEMQSASSIKAPKEYVKMRFNFMLDTGSLEIHDNGKKIARGSFHGYHISLEKREDSVTFCGNLVSMDVIDFYTKNTRYPNLISPSEVKTDTEGKQLDPYFFTMIFDKKPIDSFADYRLQLSMRPLNIIISKPFFNTLINFFNKPITRIRRRKMEEFNVRAYTRLKEIRQHTEDQLIQAMADRKIFDIQVHLSAPNIMIPKDFTNKNSPVLVLILGTLSISSDLRDKKAKRRGIIPQKVNNLDALIQSTKKEKPKETGNWSGEEMFHSDEGEGSDQFEEIDDEFFSDAGTVDGFEELLATANLSKQKEQLNETGEIERNYSYLYDKFYMSFTSLEAIITNSPLDINRKRIMDELIIERFDVNLYLQICNIDSFELPKVKVSGNLPSLKLYISPEKTTRIMQILSKLSLSTQSSSSNADNLAPSASAASLSSSSSANLVENPSESNGLDNNNVNTPKTPSISTMAAENPDTEEQMIAKAQKKQLDISFSIPEATLLIQDNNQQIALLWVKGIHASYLKRPYDVKVTLALHNLLIEDRLQSWGDEFRYLATSESLNYQSELSDLIQVTYEGITPTAPHYNYIKHSVNFHFNKLHVLLNRETILSLVSCIKRIQSSLKTDSLAAKQNQTPPPSPVQSAASPKVEHPQKVNASPSHQVDEPLKILDEKTEEEEAKTKTLKVSATMQDIGFTMNDTGVKIGLIKITNSSAGFEIGKNTMKVEGKLGGLHIQDYDPEARYYPQMIEARTDEEMVIFTYETFDQSKLKEGECGVVLLITFNHVKYIWIERFQLRIRQYFSEISAIQKYLSTTASSAAAAISKSSRLFRYDIQLRNPYIIIPRNTNTPDGLVIDLGEISISKQFPINEAGIMMTRICVNVKAMNWKSGNLKTQKHETFIPILTSTDLQMFWEKPYDEQKQLEHVYPGLNVWVHFPSLHLILSEYQCWQICATIAENICAPPTESENYVKKLKEKLHWYDTISQLSNPPQLQPQASMKSLKIKNPYADEEDEEEDDFEFQPDDEKYFFFLPTSIFSFYKIQKKKYIFIIYFLKNSKNYFSLFFFEKNSKIDFFS